MKFTHKKCTLVAASFLSLALVACGGGKGLIAYPDLPSPPSGPSGDAPIGVGSNANFYTDAGDGIVSDSCAPAIPANGQQIRVNMVAEDRQGVDNSQAIYPNLTSGIIYTFDANAGAFVATATNNAYAASPGGTYDPATGEILSDQVPTLVDPMQDSFIGFEPSDWAQRLARQLSNQPEGATATMTLKFRARGYLPNLLASLSGTSADPQSEGIENTIQARVQRVNDATVGGFAGACRFNFTLYRNFQYDPAVILLPGLHGSTDPLKPTAAAEDAAIDDLTVVGSTLSQYAGDRSSLLFLEPYMPALEGTFATSDQVPFAPISLKWTHVYGISSLSFPYYENTDGASNSRAVSSASAAAFQEFTYVP